MTMEQNNRGYRLDPSGRNGKGPFEEHNEHMREFRRSHANVAMINGSRLDKAALLERMKPLQVWRIMTETGGSALPNETIDWSALVSLTRVMKYKLSQN